MDEEEDQEDPEPQPVSSQRCRKRRRRGQAEQMSTSPPVHVVAATIGVCAVSADIVDDAVVDGLALEPGARIVPDREVRNTAGPERERWRLAAEKEVQESFLRLGAVSETTPDELARVGGRSGVLPMKAVWTIKGDGMWKCRGVACGNFADRQPTEQVWTAQAETSSVLAGLRLAMVRKWSVGTMDVKHAFMTEDIPKDMLIVVRPLQIWVDLGLVKPGTLWICLRAIYGLRQSPRIWGLGRDRKLRRARWQVGPKTFKLQQCTSDSQVWMIKEEGGSGDTYGLVIVYVDDLLLLSPAGDVRAALKEHLKSIWEMSEVPDLTPGISLSFIGLELEMESSGHRPSACIHKAASGQLRARPDE